jgi:GT2 family glycosyltransferase
VSSNPGKASGSRLRASVVIVNYNAGEKLIRCLGSVSSSLSAEAELILVDNASSDGSLENAVARFPHLKVLRSAANGGFGAGANLGARSSRGEHLVFLNPDTFVEPGWVEGLLEPLARDSKAGLATSKILQADDPGRVSACGNSVHISGLTLARGMGAPREAFRDVEPVDAVSGAAFAIRRDLFERLGGFDEDFFLYVEDTDLSLRARLGGWQCLLAPESVVYHDYTFRLTARKVFYQERNRYRMLLKCLRWPSLLVLLPSEILAEFVTWGFVLTRDRANAANKLRAYASIWTSLPSVLRQRRAVQGLRTIPDRALLAQTGFRLDFGQVAGGFLRTAGRWFFDPLFFLLKGLTLGLVWW